MHDIKLYTHLHAQKMFKSIKTSFLKIPQSKLHQIHVA